ncbi:hypothetical protein WBG99_14040 [Streptomyces sp. TG1A-60]
MAPAIPDVVPVPDSRNPDGPGHDGEQPARRVRVGPGGRWS